MYFPINKAITYEIFQYVMTFIGFTISFNTNDMQSLMPLKEP